MAIPLAGALLIVIFLLVVAIATGRMRTFARRMRAGGLNALAPVVVWSVLGVIWGALWRVSDWLLLRLGLAGPG